MPYDRDAGLTVGTPISSVWLAGVFVRGWCFSLVRNHQPPVCQHCTTEAEPHKTPMLCRWTTEGLGSLWKTCLISSPRAHADLGQGLAYLHFAALTIELWTPCWGVFTHDLLDCWRLAIVFRLANEQILQLGTDMTLSFS